MSHRLEIRATDPWVARLDAWRKERPALPSRPEAIRLIVEQALTLYEKNLQDIAYNESHYTKTAKIGVFDNLYPGVNPPLDINGKLPKGYKFRDSI